MRIMAEFVQTCMEHPDARFLGMDCITDHGEHKRHWADHFERVVTFRIFRYQLVSACLSVVYRLRKHQKILAPPPGNEANRTATQ